MPDNSYHIYIHLDGASDNKNAVAGTGTGSTGGEQENESSSPDMTVKAAKRLVSYATVKGTADTLISNHISQVALETGAVEYEQRMSTVHSISSQVLDTAVSVGVGVATGNLPLVLVGLATSALRTVINISAKEKRLKTQQSLENVSIEMSMVRAGVSGRRSANQ